LSAFSLYSDVCIDTCLPVLSDEIDNFVRIIKIDPEATFLDLHNAILKV
jgi:hypothetical protein